jgi:stearoyl-CoA desaturase (delta-9 desaturase)
MEVRVAALLEDPARPRGFQGETIVWPPQVVFWGLQLVPVAGIAWLGWSWSGAVLALALYLVRMFGITAGFHRYFAHRSFRTSRAFQLVLAVLATSSVENGPLWWAAHHRAHHRYSDTPADIHSAKQRGLFWAHMGWILVERYKQTDLARVRDLARYPELRWLDRHALVPGLALAAILLASGGLWALLWGFFVSTTLLWHGTFAVNSLAHKFGRRRYATGDESRNSFLIALFTLGEGWHNNHHHYQASERQGFYWWELDVTHYLLTVLSWFGLVWKLHAPPPHVREQWRGPGLRAP